MKKVFVLLMGSLVAVSTLYADDPEAVVEKSDVAKPTLAEVIEELYDAPHAVTPAEEVVTPQPKHEAKWPIDTLSLEEKVGQLLIVRSAACREESEITRLIQLVEEYHIGGVCWFDGRPKCQLDWIKRCQEESEIPLLMTQDCEWGVTMRMSGATRLPHNIVVGAVDDDDLTFRYGQEVGHQCRMTGIHMNFGPVVDVNTCRENPVIHDRAFGEDPIQVARLANLVMEGMATEGVLACIKHFPGHGETSRDSHLALPIVNLSREELKDHLFPFGYLLDDAPAVMIGHIAVPALDETLTPASLSYPIVTELLREKMGYEGVIVTDGLEMGALDERGGVEVAIEAFEAGNDVLLLPRDVGAVYRGLLKAVKRGRISEERLNASVERILHLKEGIETKVPDFDSFALRRPQSRALKQEIFRKAVTTRGPTIHLEGRVALVESGRALRSLRVGLRPYQRIRLNKDADEVLDRLRSDSVVIALSHLDIRKAGFGIDPAVYELIYVLQDEGVPFAVALFGSPYAADLFEGHPVIIGYEDDPAAQAVVAELLQR